MFEIPGLHISEVKVFIYLSVIIQYYFVENLFKISIVLPVPIFGGVQDYSFLLEG